MGKIHITCCIVALSSFFGSNIFAQSKTVQKTTDNSDVKVVSTSQNFSVKKADAKTVIAANPGLVNPSLNNVSFDYNSMPLEVRNRVSANKNNGKPILDGVLKGYAVDIDVCKSESSTAQTLLVLNGMKGYYKSVFMSPGKVKIIVSPEMSSVDLKNKMLSSKLKFNFTEEFYLLK